MVPSDSSASCASASDNENAGKERAAAPRKRRREKVWFIDGSEGGSVEAEATVDLDDFAGQEGGSLGRQEHRHVGHVLGRAFAPGRSALGDRLAVGRGVEGVV